MTYRIKTGNILACLDRFSRLSASTALSIIGYLSNVDFTDISDSQVVIMVDYYKERNIYG